MDKNTTDKGWAAMRTLLDREMPEKRRRLAWWWLALLLIPVAGYGTWQWLEPSAEPGQKQGAGFIEPIAGLSPVSEPSVPNQPEKNAPVSTQNSAGVYKSPAAFGSLSSSINRKNSVEGLGVENEDSKQNPIAEVSSVNLTSSERLETVQLIHNSADKTRQIEHSMFSLQPLPITSTLIDRHDVRSFSLRLVAVEDYPKPVQKVAVKRWAFGATMALSTEQFNSINGFSTGVNVDWNFARKWGLRTGAIYNIHTPQEKYRPVASVLSADYRTNVYGDVILYDGATGMEVTNIMGSNNYGDSLAGNVFIPINRLHRLEVPVTVFWQASRPLKITGGLSLTRTLSAKAARQNYSGDYILELADKTAEYAASKLSSSELDNWSADAMVGLGVKPGKNFELGFLAKMPLSKFPGIAKTSQAGFNQGLADQSFGSTRKQNGPVFSLYGTLFF